MSTISFGQQRTVKILSINDVDLIEWTAIEFRDKESNERGILLVPKAKVNCQINGRLQVNGKIKLCLERKSRYKLPTDSVSIQLNDRFDFRTVESGEPFIIPVNKLVYTCKTCDD